MNGTLLQPTLGSCTHLVPRQRREVQEFVFQKSVHSLEQLLLGSMDLGSDPIQIPPALRGEPAAGAVGVLLDPLERLQGLQGFAGHRS